MFDDLASVSPGAALAAALSRVDRSVLNGFELVELAKATARQIAHYQAELLAAVWESAYCPPGDETSPPERIDHPDEFAADEIRFALTLTRRAADALLGTAYQLVERLPAAHEALRSGGSIWPRHACSTRRPRPSRSRPPGRWWIKSYRPPAG